MVINSWGGITDGGAVKQVDDISQIPETVKMTCKYRLGKQIKAFGRLTNIRKNEH